MENQNNNFDGNQSPLSSGGFDQGVPILQKIKKPKIRWLGAISIFFISLCSILFYYFGVLWVETEAIFFFSIPAAFCSLVYLSALYRAEAVLLKDELTWRKIVISNLSTAAVICLMIFLSIKFFVAGIFVEAEKGAFSFIVTNMICFVFVAMLFFSFIPSVFLKINYPDTIKSTKYTFLLFSIFFFIFAGYSLIKYESCDFRNAECLSDLAEDDNNFRICDKIKSQNERNYCYYDVDYSNNEPSVCEKIKEDDIEAEEGYKNCYEKIISSQSGVPSGSAL